MCYQKPRVNIKNNTLILAICGKSGTGKSSLAQWLHKHFLISGHDTHLVLSDTTRPARDNEEQAVDYYFIDDYTFGSNIYKNYYLEYAKFRDWYYGIPKHRIKKGYVNIVVVNPEGLDSLSNMKDKATIIPIYLESSWFTRLSRSIKRENKFKFEYIRRIFADRKAFKYIIPKILRFDNYVIAKNDHISVYRTGLEISMYLGRYL